MAGNDTEQIAAADFSMNTFTGSLPTSWSKLTQSIALYLEQNNLMLKFLDVGSNDLIGTLPSEWSTSMPSHLITHAVHLFMAVRHLFGLDLSRNSLTGALPEPWESLAKVSYATFAAIQLSGRAFVLPNIKCTQLGLQQKKDVAKDCVVSKQTSLPQNYTPLFSGKVRRDFGRFSQMVCTMSTLREYEEYPESTTSVQLADAGHSKGMSAWPQSTQTFVTNAGNMTSKQIFGSLCIADLYFAVQILPSTGIVRSDETNCR
ncbi:hypothetical protein WJX77_002868 [Trebouxia sp. C0004]